MIGPEDREASPGVRCRLRLILGLRIIERLEQDPMAVGSSIPSIRAIASASGAHRNTVAAVMSDLARFGLARCAVGSGCTVSCPPSAHDPSRALFCVEREAARLLTIELGRPVSACASAPPGSLVFQPLDLPPLSSARGIPLAPRAATLTALRTLCPGSTAIVASRSSLVQRVLSQSIRAVHGGRVSVMNLGARELDSDLSRSPLFGPSTVVFHDSDCRVVDRTVEACPVLIAPPKAVDTG